MKLAVVRTLHNRANTHCTYANDGLKERKRVSQALMMNGYPRRVSQGGRTLTRNQSTQDGEQSHRKQQYMQRFTEEYTIRPLSSLHPQLCNTLLTTLLSLPLDLSCPTTSDSLTQTPCILLKVTNVFCFLTIAQRTYHKPH